MIMVVVMVMVMVMVVMVAVMSAVPFIMIMLVTWHVFAVVPIVANKIHGPTAGVIFSAVARPMPLVSRRYMQIDRLIGERRVPVNHHGPGINQRGGLRHATDIDLAIETGLADVD